MIRLLQLLVFGHAHKWVTFKTVKVLGYQAKEDSVPVGTEYHCKCESCGVIRKFKV